MFKEIWKNEKRPDKWKFTDIVQIFKGKGDFEDLSNSRFIHMKDYITKAFETGLVDRSFQKS